jgi:Calcineurin-like phosphoesterase
VTPTIDPRRGDIEDDASSPKRRSMLSLAGSLLVEISIPKLVVAWLLLIVFPGLMLGLAPIVASIWFSKISDRITSSLAEIWSAILVAIFVGLGWFGGRRVFQLAERSFWSLNSLAVQPCYTVCREALRHLLSRHLPREAGGIKRPTLHATTAVLSGLIICGIALLALIFAWKSSHLLSDATILRSPKSLAIVALANSVVIVSAYVAAAALVWAIADATMDAPRDLEGYDVPPDRGHSWRIVHLSDIHTVGERFGFRIESGRSGPRGNERLRQLLAQLDALHAREPLHGILITGDMTDAGRSTEWAEFFDAIARYPRLTEIMLILPGNHDLNIVDRANPARLDLPTSQNKKLRKVRMLSAMAAVQGARVRLVDQKGERLGESLAAALAPHLGNVVAFADAGKPRMTNELLELWNCIFPMVLPPDRDDGLGVILLNSNADTHFSFTNALGMIPAEQVRGIAIASRQYPRACWLIALHHHVVEYPRPAKALSERIGTTLVNGNWFVRALKFLAGRAVLMHGHRHVDWIGTCCGLRILSAPSPVMDATDDQDTCFYLHTLAAGTDRRLRLLQPQRITVAAGQTDTGERREIESH